MRRLYGSADRMQKLYEPQSKQNRAYTAFFNETVGPTDITNFLKMKIPNF